MRKSSLPLFKKEKELLIIKEFISNEYLHIDTGNAPSKKRIIEDSKVTEEESAVTKSEEDSNSD